MSLTSLKSEYDKAINNDDLEKISEIIAVINGLPIAKKRDYVDLYEQIEDELFQKEKSVSNLDLKQLKEDIKSWEEKKNTAKVERKSGVEEFDEAFVQFYNLNRTVFADLKNFYLIRLENSEVEANWIPIILCDSTSINLPALNGIKTSTENQEVSCAKKQINELVESINPLRGPLHNYLCVLCINPDLKGIEDITESLSVLFGHFDIVSLLTVKARNVKISATDVDEENKQTTIFELLGENCSKVFNNISLSYDNERIIKSFFRGTAIINYRILNPGASGSVVIEVQATPTHMRKSKRYVVKIALKDTAKPGKLKSEMKNYDTFVKDAPTINTNYQAEYHENEAMEAIKYSYASSGSIEDAKSFAEILGSYFTSPTSTAISINKITAALFSCELITHWNMISPKQSKCQSVYESFLRKEDEIVNMINDINDKNVESANLIEFYQRVKEFTLSYNEKTCHGDLHSDNFFWDGQHVTLIDFGITGRHHAVVDHSSLETSIRVKHFPRHVPIDEIMKYEELFIDDKTFDGSLDLSFISRERLREIFGNIMLIRQDSVKYFVDPKVSREYFISLFLLMFRQIQYRDLNQLYALRMADLLAKKISL
ncbi:MAG: Ternary complex associated domain 9 [Bacteroidota bacterium]|jgi:hypothetical protein